MKKALFLMVILSSFVANAAMVRTKLQAKIRFHRIDGKVTKLAPIRVFITHDTDINLLNLNRAQACQIEIGKKDILSLGLETETFRCFATKDRIIVDNESLVEVLYRTGMFAFSSTHIDRVYDISNTGKITNESLGNTTLTSALGNIFGELTKLQQISLTKATDFSLVDSSGREKYTIELTPKTVEYAE